MNVMWFNTLASFVRISGCILYSTSE
jgi:hypothetical protein